jgi:hypothetical protein
MLRYTFLMLVAVSFRPRFIISLMRSTFLPFRSTKMGHEADYPIWFDGVAEVARRFPAGVVLPFAGAAQTRGPFHLTMDTNDVIETARAFPDAVIVPLHTDGWAHFRQNAGDLRLSFDALGFGARLKLLEPGVATVIEPSTHAPA